MTLPSGGKLTGSPDSFHAAILGMLGSAARDENRLAGWETSIERSASRTPRDVIRRVHASFAAAYRGHASGFFQDADWTVLLDGSVDNLRAIAEFHHLPQIAAQSAPGETLARLVSIEGTSVLGKLTGSFAFALVRNETGETLLVRDRFGTKPMFYAPLGSGWAWASEIKCLCPFLERTDLDEEGLRQSIHYRYMVGETLVEGVRQVMPASYVRLAPDAVPIECLHWKLDFRPVSGRDELDHWADRADAALDAVLARLRRDHDEIGVLLSGGVDSSLLAFKASRSGFRKCIAFTARWPGENPELEWASDVTQKLGIEHRIVDIDESYLGRAFPWLVWRMEEAPRHYNSFALASLFEAASGNCEVLLHGLAADAMFGSQSCVAIDAFVRRQAQLRFISGHLSGALAKALPDDAESRLGRLKGYLSHDVHGYVKTKFRIPYGELGERIFRRYGNSIEPGRLIMDRFYDPAEDLIERFQRFCLYTFDQSHLAVLDRLGAPLGIFVSVPFLSPEIVEVAAALPSKLKRHGATSKPVLKLLASRYFPSEWIYRKKLGFPTPTSHWLRGPLSEWRELLNDERGGLRDLLDLQALHSAEIGRDDEAIWTSMALEMFRRQFTAGDGGPATRPAP